MKTNMTEKENAKRHFKYKIAADCSMFDLNKVDHLSKLQIDHMDIKGVVACNENDLFCGVQ